MKKILTLLIIGIILCTLMSCSNQSIDFSIFQQKNAAEPAETIEQSAETLEQLDEIPHADIEWTNASYLICDRDGYQYEINIKISPWILTENSGTLNAAWSEVGNNNQLPNSIEDWGLRKEESIYERSSNNLKGVKDGNSYSYRASMTDMYYCVGSISIENVTEGWDISAADSRSLEYSIIFDLKNWAGLSNTIGRVYYNSKTEDSTGGLCSSPKLTDNTWGPCSFVIMHPENYSPNNPDGEFYEKLLDRESYFHYLGRMGVMSETSHTINGNGTEEPLRIGVIGKDDIYVPND